MNEPKLMTMAIVLFLAALGNTYLPVQGSCSVDIAHNTYIAVAAELVTSTGYPDVIVLENSLIKVVVVPNRGRLLFDYVYKPSGQHELYSNTKPLPLLSGETYMAEFGGYYLSYPWNDRSNQPYDLDFKVVKDTVRECSIRILPFKSWLQEHVVLPETIISIKEDDPKVYLKVKIQNLGSKDISLNLFDRSIITAGKVTDATRIVLPDDITEVKVGKNEEGWMGEPGSLHHWPQPWSSWGAFSTQGAFSIDISETNDRWISVYNPETGETFTKTWSETAPYKRIDVASWGPQYEHIMGAYPGFCISGIADNLIISANSVVEFEIQFYAST